MQIESSKIDQTVVLEIKGRMDVIAAMQYEKTITEGLQRGERNLLWTSMPWTILAAQACAGLLTIAKKIKEVKGTMNFCNVKGVVKEVFAMSGFDSILPIFKSVKDALPS